MPGGGITGSPLPESRGTELRGTSYSVSGGRQGVTDPLPFGGFV